LAIEKYDFITRCSSFFLSPLCHLVPPKLKFGLLNKLKGGIGVFIMENFKSAVDAFLRNELERDELASQLEQAIKQTPRLSTQILSHLTELHQADSLSAEDYSALNSRLKSFSPLSRPSQWEEDEDMAIEPGLVILDKYRLVEELGKGGMGIVWKAIDLIQEEGEARDSHVAIKFLSQDFKQHPDALKALVREFKRYERLSHPNIVKAHKLDRLGTTFFMVMEFLKGVPLDEFIQSRKNGLSLSEAEPIIKDMAHALAYAHQEGLAHLDFKPANVFYDSEAKSAKVIDFGIARPLEQSEREKTGFDPGALGALTNAYASYEMLLSLDPDQRDDIYALACVTYELLSGKHPFNKQKATTAKYEKLSPEPLPGLKRQQEQALLRGLAFYRDDRTPTVDEFLAELFPEKKKPVLGLVGGGLVAAIVAGFVAWELFKPQIYKPPEEPAPRVAQGQDQIAAEQERQRLEEVAQAEAARLAAEQEAARKKAEAARLAAEQEAQAEAARLAAEQEEAQAEAARLAAEQEEAQAEAARLAAEQEEAQAEAARLAAEQEEAQVARLLQECQKHLDAKRLTSGRGGTALACYQEVLKQDAGNVEALDGLHKIELSYQNLAESAFRQKRLQKVPNYLRGLERVNPQSPILANLRERYERENLARQQEEARKQAEAERQAREEAERQARAEAERQAREEAERQARAEAERQAREEAERQARAEAERQAREEARREETEEEDSLEKFFEQARRQQARDDYAAEARRRQANQ
jgi:murein DD-endopeptidase MepM/ murein hydrolase activator NlpD